MESQTAKLENINKFSKYGLRRRPTYEEITNLLDENKKLGLPLPNRDATFFRNSPEGSFFDGIHQMEDLKDEQQRLLLRQMNDLLMRQNIRTAGRTYHTERARLNAFRPPQISEANMQVDEEGTPQPMPQRMPQPSSMPSTRLQQASQLNMELQQRGNRVQKRRDEIAMNEAEQVRKFTKPTLQEQLLGLQPPRTQPENIPIFSSGDEALQPVKVKKKNLNATVSASSSQAPMDLSSQPKRNEPETRVEPRGKAGRPKMFKYGTDRADGTKRDGEEPEDTTNRKKSKRTNKNKEKQQKRLEAKIAKETVNVEGEDADDEVDDTRKGSRVKKSIEKPKIPSKANIQIIFEELTNAKNKNTITAEEYKEFNEVFQEFRKAKGKEKSKQTAKAKDIYKKLYPKLKKKYDEMK